jgi:uncharacterized protein (DUF2147 family)
MKFLSRAAVAAIVGLALWSAAHAALPPEGTWLSADGGTKVRIVNCGGKLCGKVVWLNEPIDPATGKPKTDKRNPNQDKRSRPLLGVQVVQGMAPTGANKWSGEIYNADDGKTYQAHVMVLSENAMQVQGCVLGFLCKSQTWTRAD